MIRTTRQVFHLDRSRSSILSPWPHPPPPTQAYYYCDLANNVSQWEHPDVSLPYRSLLPHTRSQPDSRPAQTRRTSTSRSATLRPIMRSTPLLLLPRCTTASTRRASRSRVEMVRMGRDDDRCDEDSAIASPVAWPRVDPVDRDRSRRSRSFGESLRHHAARSQLARVCASIVPTRRYLARA